MTDLVTSAANPLIKRMRLLAVRKHRRRQGAFVVHGIQPVWQAVAAGAHIEALVVAPELLISPAATRMVSERAAAGVPVTNVSGALFTRLADRDAPTGLAAIVRGRPAELGALRVEPDSLFVALHEIANPGNLGTILRTADAVGAGGVVLIGSTTDPYDPTAVKASMGALFNVPVAHAASVADFSAWADAGGLSLVTTSAAADDDFRAVRYPSPLVIVLGSEGPGLPSELLARGHLRVRIPMVGTAESLNLAVAAGLLMYEVRRTGGAFPAPAGRTVPGSG